MTIQLPLSDETFEAELVQDELGVLWVAERAAVAGVVMDYRRLAQVIDIGWRIVSAKPHEQALLDAHGFGTERLQ
jgi:hypothetical protein